MKKEDLKNLSKEELVDKLNDSKKKLMELRFQRKVGHVEKPHLFKQTKRSIARILTTLKEKKQ
jgi:large subunit ribosomal protein L29